MKNIEQIYTNCLAQGSYFVESEGEAVVIDPLREPKPYIDRARERGVKIKYILETHFHADFVSGHLDLAKETGATIVYGPKAETSFEKHTATDGEELKVGKLTIRVLHTPGHTPESTTYLLLDENGKEHAIFTGDTLFIGDVGRPDLAQKATGLTQEDLAGWLFDSLRNKIMPLPDDVIVYPAHGAGSSCGKNMSSETWDTLGNQKKTNYALRADMTKEEFIKEVTDGLQAPPQYFSLNAGLNKKGYGSFEEAMSRGLNPQSVEQFKAMIAQNDVILLDVRDKKEFVESHIPGSMFIGLDGSFAPWVGALITDINQKIALVCPVGREEETVRRLARVGYDNAVGYLDGGFESWKNASEETASIDTITVEEFVKSDINKQVVDVRNTSEYSTTHFCGSLNVPLDHFPTNNTDVLDKEKSYFVHCRSGFRSTVASSILKRRGIHNITNVIGSFDVIKENLEVEGTCPSLIA
ncbi:MAG: MBL fold metallo-hydrolase [Saprospiraceae bacterium]|nr:MBL fold metallo-hydrolase [Saprospiraceae bacterium]